MVDYNKLARYIDLEDAKTAIEKEQEGLKFVLKAQMNHEGIKSVKHNNRVLTIVDSVRKTIAKEDLVVFLAGRGFKSCIKFVTEPDMDIINSLIDSGDIDPDEIAGFIKQTPVCTMKLK